MTTLTDAQDARDTVRATIEANSACDTPYLTMNVLATLIACYGLLKTSPAVVIGAMLIAMLLGPISGIALGLVDGNDSLVRKAFLSLLGGAAVDLMIALCGGAAGAYATTSTRMKWRCGWRRDRDRARA